MVLRLLGRFGVLIQNRAFFSLHSPQGIGTLQKRHSLKQGIGTPSTQSLTLGRQPLACRNQNLVHLRGHAIENRKSACEAELQQTRCFEFNIKMEDGSKEECRDRVEKAQTAPSLMVNEEIPHVLDYPSLLRWCQNVKDLGYVHHEICCNSMESDPYIGVILVEMYLKCEAGDDAHTIFFSLRLHSVFSWNLIIRSYTSQGQDAEAVQCLKHIHRESSIPDKYSYVSAISSCVNLTNLQETKQIHTHLVGTSDESNVVVGNALVNAYAKCGSISQASNVFDKMLQHDSFSWDTLIVAHVQYKMHKEAVGLFEHQQNQGVLPTRITYVVILDACAILGANSEVPRMLARVFGSEHIKDVSIQTSTLNLFGRHGCSEGAWTMSSTMIERNLNSWNAIFAVHSNVCWTKGVFELYDQMLIEGVLPNQQVFIRVISLCTTHDDLAFGKHLHAGALGVVHQLETTVGNVLIGMYNRCDGLEGTFRVFDGMGTRNIVSWTTMIAAYVEHGQGMQALESFLQMLAEGVLPDKVLLIGMLDACASLRSLLRLHHIHARIVGMGLVFDFEVASSLASSYGKCGGLNCAGKIFDQIFERNTHLWTAMISACTQHYHADEAMQLFYQMEQEGTLPNEVTLYSVLDACARVSALAAGRRFHVNLSATYEGDVSIKTALIDMYGKCGSLEEAQRVFDNVYQQDSVILTAMMAAYAQNGQIKQALRLFDKMLRDGVKPDEVAFIHVLSMCSHAGLLDDGRHYFLSMSSDHGIAPTAHHYSCMIDLLAKAGCLMEAEAMINDMPFPAMALHWMTLLCACRRKGDVERGDRAANLVMQLDSKSWTPYVELSNI